MGSTGEAGRGRDLESRSIADQLLLNFDFFLGLGSYWSGVVWTGREGGS